MLAGIGGATTPSSAVADEPAQPPVLSKEGRGTPLVEHFDDAAFTPKLIHVDTGDAGEFSEFFAPLDADVPVSTLTGNNRVVVTSQPGTTITSVQLMTLR